MVTPLVLSAATGILSTLPGPLRGVADYLPTHGAVIALRTTVTGGPGLLRGLVELAIRCRSLSTKRLRHTRHDLSQPTRLILGAWT